jgi:hypothetical protein
VRPGDERLLRSTPSFSEAFVDESVNGTTKRMRRGDTMYSQRINPITGMADAMKENSGK